MRTPRMLFTFKQFSLYWSIPFNPDKIFLILYEDVIPLQIHMENNLFISTNLFKNREKMRSLLRNFDSNFFIRKPVVILSNFKIFKIY